MAPFSLIEHGATDPVLLPAPAEHADSSAVTSPADATDESKPKDIRMSMVTQPAELVMRSMVWDRNPTHDPYEKGACIRQRVMGSAPVVLRRTCVARSRLAKHAHPTIPRRTGIQ